MMDTDTRVRATDAGLTAKKTPYSELTTRIESRYKMLFGRVASKHRSSDKMDVNALAEKQEDEEVFDWLQEADNSR